jgi:hypothetical protein
LFFALIGLAAPGAVAQDARYRPPPSYTSGGKADQNEGAQILRGFRTAGIAGTYWLAFELRVMPRQGAERTVPGQLLGTRTGTGPVSRLTLPGAGGLATEQRWLIQSGPQAAAWTWTGATNRTAALAAADSFQPIAGTDLTLFDLQMPYLYWPEFVYEGVAKVRGRPAHSFVLYPPAELAAARPELTGVRVLLDTQFQALVQAELLGAKGETVKSFTVLDLKKVGEQWMLKSVDLRNHRTRDKTRFTVTGAALNLALPPEAFTPAGLAAEAPAVPEARIERF